MLSVRNRALGVGLAAVLYLGGMVAWSHHDAKAARQPTERLPAASAFHDGACRTVAEPVLDLARLAARDRDARTVSQPDRAMLEARQAQIIEAAAQVTDAELKARWTALTTAIGFVRIRLDSHTYDPRLLDDMDAARKDLQRACVGMP